MARQMLAPSAVELLEVRRDLQANDRELVGEAWPGVTYEGERLDLVFTNALGGPMLRQHVDRELRKAAGRIGLDASTLGTHTGRRSVVTNLYATGTFDLSDVAGFVGHGDVATTRGYVQHEGERPTAVSARAFQLLDLQASDGSADVDGFEIDL
ncbi:MAG: tyrosine-type recombinase/integrase [Actinomycetota bacterium]